MEKKWKHVESTLPRERNRGEREREREREREWK